MLRLRLAIHWPVCSPMSTFLGTPRPSTLIWTSDLTAQGARLLVADSQGTLLAADRCFPTSRPFSINLGISPDPRTLKLLWPPFYRQQPGVVPPQGAGLIFLSQV
ncbi:uncharacterized protein LOC119576550 [Penaeus monodon]|uniref:uncharacterized protein LOC119576550 n=1 Tax=Penaeus monodon TaxID=6687 RepID=UPI0018A7733E|nr:uncharacterized protein LOC119576550 [Penaeus monodon]